MATRGVFQLKRLSVYYCEHGGSSRSIREFIANGRLSEWAAAHPHVDIHVNRRNGKHPYVHGDYKTAAAVHQVSVKNSSLNDIEDVLDMLHNRSGRKITKITKPVLTDTPSIQGVWTPFLNLSDTEFAVSIDDGDKATASEP